MIMFTILALAIVLTVAWAAEIDETKIWKDGFWKGYQKGHIEGFIDCYNQFVNDNVIDISDYRQKEDEKPETVRKES